MGENKQAEAGKGKYLKKRLTSLLALLLVIAITTGICYLVLRYPGKIEELKAYGYLGTFLISLILNATVILPAGNIVVVSALGGALDSVIEVGLVAGVGAAIGEMTGYMAGYSGRAVVENRQEYRRVERWMRRWGGVTIFVFAVVPFVFDLAGIAAGVLRYPLWKFLLLCCLGRSLLYIFVALTGTWWWEALLQFLG